MKKSLLTRLLSVLMALCMLVGVLTLTACKGGDNGDGTGTTGSGTQATTGGDDDVDNDSEEVIYRPTLQRLDAAYEYNMYAHTQDEYGTAHFASADGKTDIINESLRRREILMQDYYNVVCKLTISNEVGKTLTQRDRSKQYFADLVFMRSTTTMEKAQNGMLYDLNALEELNLEASYWDQRIQNDYRIGDMLFCVVGDYDTMDELVTFGVLVNHTVYNGADYDDTYGSIYNMVRTNAWDYSTMLEMAAPITGNADEDPTMNEHDKWGLVSERQAAGYFFLGSGIRPIESVDGELILNLKDDITKNKATGLLQEILKIGTNANVLFAEDLTGDVFVVAADIFEANRALFRTTSLSDAFYLGDMQDDFGILPIPQQLEDQTEYYCYSSASANTPLAIPKSVGDAKIAQTAAIAEAMSYHSRYGNDEPLYESFFERLTALKVCRSENDREMLTLAFESKIFDLDTALGVMGIYAYCSTDIKNKTGGAGVATDMDGWVQVGDSMLPQIVETFTEKNAA